GSSDTTNNKMELTAVIEGLKALKKPCSVRLFTDSKYVADGLTKGWAKSWKANNWKKKDGKMALNIDLWDELLKVYEIHEVEIVWVKGHAGHPENERCDVLAVEQSHKFR
ncbi:MAG: ribonuclease H, partial [Oscillospiraceae bacterium]